MNDGIENLALDLDLFDNTKNGYVPAEKKRKRFETPRLIEPKAKTASEIADETRASRIAALKAVCFSIIALTIIGSLICVRVTATNLKADLTAARAEYSLAESEGVRLQMALNSMISIDKVEEYAQSELGMIKRENYQIYYFDIAGEDGASVVS